MSDVPTLPSDRQLVIAVRSGNDAAWAELMSRHEASVRLIRPRRGRHSKRNVGRAMDELRTSIVRDPEPAEGEIAVRAFRPRAIAACTGGAYGPHRSEAQRGVPNADAQRVADQRLLASAFGRLPEPWQTALWHTSVEQLTAAEVSPLVGRSVDEVGELIATAQRGLVDAFLVEYAQREQFDPASKRAVSLLGGYVRGALPPREQLIVEAHLRAPRPSTRLEPDEGEVPVGSSTEPQAEPAPPSTNATSAPPADPPAGAPAATPVDARDGVLTASDTRRVVEIISSLDDWLPAAIAPGVTGLSVDDHRAALGTTTRSFGTATLFANRSTRGRRLALVGSAFAIVIALVGAAFLLSRPFERDDTISRPSIETLPEATVATTAQPPTTDVELRPEPDRENPIELVFEPGTRTSGLVPPELELSVALASPGPILAGGTGTIDIGITNDGSIAAETNFEMQLPSGLAFEAVADGDVECDDPPDEAPFCNVSAAPGETTTIALRFRLESSVVGRLVVDGELITEPLDVPIVRTSRLVHSAVVRGDVITIGNSLLTCADSAAARADISCDDVRAGVGEIVNRWDVPLEFVDVDTARDFENSSSATLDLPATAEVLGAYLFWSGDLDESDVTLPADGRNEIVVLVAPDGTVSELAADQLILGDVDATHYLGSVEATDLVRSGGAGEYTVANVQSAEVRGSYAGWSLVVVTADVDQPRRHLLVTQPFHRVAPEPQLDYEVDLPVPAVTQGAASLDIVAFEGERGFVPETLMVGDDVIGGDNMFDGSIAGDRNPAYTNSLGVDIDTYDLVIDTPDGTLRISSQSEKDGVRIAVLGIAIDLES